jgi:hypothetical protein
VLTSLRCCSLCWLDAPLSIVTAGRERSAAARAMCSHVAEVLLSVIVPAQAAPTHELAAQAVLHVAALDVRTSKASGGGDVWVGASGARRKWQLFYGVTITEAGVRVDTDVVELRPSGPTLEAEG